MDISSLIAIVVVIVVIYYLIKFIVSPLLKAIAGIVFLLVAVYVLQHYLNFNLSNILGPFAKYLDVSTWGPGFSWILSPLNYYLDQAQTFILNLLNNLPKSK